MRSATSPAAASPGSCLDVARHGADAGERLDGPDHVRADVAAIGEGTAAAFAAGPTASRRFLPRTFTVDGLARAFPRGAGRVLCARADIAP